MKIKPFTCGVLLLVLLCPAAYGQSYDPWRNTNERVFRFNDYFDTILVRPVAQGYTTFVPRFLRQGIGNFFSNLNDINVFVNDLLQLKLEDAASDGGRFLINSTIGVAGILDVASEWGLDKNQEDFGQTLGAWGVSSGPYVVLPVFGTSTVRDSFGLVLDTLFNPIQYHEEGSVRFSLFIVEEVDFRSGLLALDELVTGDRYLFYREAYLQNREYLVNDGQVEDAFGDFGDF
ncbi:MAG: VacJ family lipoprotein [Gimesia chilikensis]